MKYTKDEFIEKAKRIHNEKYDYSKVKYKNISTKVFIICKKHGVFAQRPVNHLSGRGCQKCGNQKMKKTNSFSKEEFIKRAQSIHGKYYNYEKVLYINNCTKIIIECPKHGFFSQFPNGHMIGQQCPKCSIEDSRGNTEQFIQKAIKIHENRYDYSKVKYSLSKNKIDIICNTHGIFIQRASHHLLGRGCPKCFTDSCRSTIEDFISKAIEVHGDLYDYSKVNYIQNKTKVQIICKKHKEFEQAPTDHLSGKGCPVCRSSVLEKTTQKILNEFHIIYERQKRFDKCRYILPLVFDFYLPDHNAAIECQGVQHYQSSEYWGGKGAFLTGKIRDMIKSNYCHREGIKLIEIPYWDNKEKNIKDIISKVILTA